MYPLYGFIVLCTVMVVRVYAKKGNTYTSYVVSAMHLFTTCLRIVL